MTWSTTSESRVSWLAPINPYTLLCSTQNPKEYTFPMNIHNNYIEGFFHNRTRSIQDINTFMEAVITPKELLLLPTDQPMRLKIIPIGQWVTKISRQIFGLICVSSNQKWRILMRMIFVCIAANRRCYFGGMEPQFENNSIKLAPVYPAKQRRLALLLMSVDSSYTYAKSNRKIFNSIHS